MEFALQDADRQVLAVLKDFIPEQVFDAHAHLYVASTVPSEASDQGLFCREYSTVEDYMQHMGQFLPGAKQIRLNLIPMPDPIMRMRENGLRDVSNNHVFSQLRQHPEHVGCAYVLMDDSRQQIENLLDNPGVAGIKCYSYAATTQSYNSCTVEQFLPEAAWDVAQQAGVPIILHLMKPDALADCDNLRYIKTMCRRYSNAKLVLAHCARGFASWTVINTIKELSGLENVWFDFSAICEPSPMASCIMHTAGKRVMWGSDYPMSMYRGKAISVGSSFHWIIDREAAWLQEKGASVCYLGLENLLALRQSCIMQDLDATQIRDIFYNNAARLFCKE